MNLKEDRAGKRICSGGREKALLYEIYVSHWQFNKACKIKDI